MKFRIKQLFKMLFQHVIFPFVYFINRWRPVDKELVVLADSHHEDCPPHMRAVRDALKHDNLKVAECFFDTSRKNAIKGLLAMAGFMKLYATAGCVIICDNFLPVASCRKKKKTLVIQLWHGCGAFKRFGYDAENDIPRGYHGNVYKNYDIVTVSGEKCVPYFKSAMGIADTAKDSICPIGVSSTDRLFDENYIAACRDTFRYEYPDAAGKKVILWAPSFRGNAAEARLEGEKYIDALMEDEELRDSVYVIKSLHPHIKAPGYKQRMTGEELLCCADVLITDYSSIFFEYLLLDRPIVFFAPDYNIYSRERGFYLDYTALPGEIILGGKTSAQGFDMDKNLLQQLQSGVKSAIYNQSDTKNGQRSAYREAYMSACDGRATNRIVDIVLEGLGYTK